jgi:CDP-glucose 4,6-dehydratase
MENMVTIKSLSETYGGKRVFLTGHTGFKGSWLLKLFNMLDAEVMGYSLPPENEMDLFNLINGDKISNSIFCDIRDRNRLIDEISNFQPDFVFHLAAQPLVRASYDIPAETFEVNAIGTANLLDGVRNIKKDCSVVLITTDKVYHNNEWLYPYRENDRLGGYDPYSASKACAELVIDSYRNSFFNVANYNDHLKSLAVGRAGNVIGGGDWAKDRLVPDIVRSISSGNRVSIRNPNAIRPWQHVMEPLLGYLILGQKLNSHPRGYSQAYNFGPNVENALSVKDMLQIVIEKWGSGQYEFSDSTNEPHEAGLLKLDISKSINELNWLPKLSASDTVRYTIDWYKSFYAGVNMDDYTAKQIESFLSTK